MPSTGVKMNTREGKKDELFVKELSPFLDDIVFGNVQSREDSSWVSRRVGTPLFIEAEEPTTKTGKLRRDLRAHDDGTAFV